LTKSMVSSIYEQHHPFNLSDFERVGSYGDECR